MLKKNELVQLAYVLLIAPFIIVLSSKFFSLPGEIAGGAFVLLGPCMLVWIMRKKHFKPNRLFWSIFAYALFSVFLFGGNLSHFGEKLDTYTFIGINAKLLHHFVELIYLVVFVTVVSKIYQIKRLTLT
jgi:hypothetical protein